MDNSFSSLIDSATSVLVLLPQTPSFDIVAAGLALDLSIAPKKTTSIACQSPMMVGFNRLIGVDKITPQVGNKNLTIKFKGYEAANIEKVSYDIIDGEFNLTVVPKQGFTAPGRDQMDMSFSGVSADLVILVGGTNDADFPILASDELTASKIVHIGNRSFTSVRQVMSFARPAAGISELVAMLIKGDTQAIDADIATNLVMGIEAGSSNFASPEVTPETFETFAFLLRSGGKRMPLSRLSPVNFPPGSIPTQPFNKPVMQTQPQMPQETDAMDANTTGETEQEINPPDDWLKPKVFQGANAPMAQPDAFSENKG